MFHIKWWVFLITKMYWYQIFTTFECHFKPNYFCQIGMGHPVVERLKFFSGKIFRPHSATDCAFARDARGPQINPCWAQRVKISLHKSIWFKLFWGLIGSYNHPLKAQWWVPWHPSILKVCVLAPIDFKKYHKSAFFGQILELKLNLAPMDWNPSGIPVYTSC